MVVWPERLPPFMQTRPLERHLCDILPSVNRQSINQSNLQKVIAGTATAGGDRALILGDGAEDAEFGVEVFADVHDGGYVAAAVAVVGSGPDGHDGLLGEVVLGRGLLA